MLVLFEYFEFYPELKRKLTSQSYKQANHTKLLSHLQKPQKLEALAILPPQPELTVESVLQQWEGPLLHYASRFLGGRNEVAEDIVQDAFLKLVQAVNKNGFEQFENVRAWLYRVVHNECMDYLRKQKLEKTHFNTLFDQGTYTNTSKSSEVVHQLELHEEREQILHYLDMLEISEKEVLILKYTKNFTLKEIASVMDCHHSSVAYLLNKALAKMTSILKAKGFI